jgi:hypothetical protein
MERRGTGPHFAVSLAGGFAALPAIATNGVRRSCEVPARTASFLDII